MPDPGARPKRSLILAGGGVKVAFQAGVLQVWLDEAGLRFDHADGASGGTFNLAMLCQGMSGTGIADAWRRTSPLRGVSPNLRQFVRPGYLESLFTLDGWRRNVFPRWGLDWDRIRASPLEATFNVYDVTRQRLRVLPPSEMSEDVLAGCVSLPVWFPPVRVGGNLCIDPVYVTDANVQEAVDRGADEIWAVWTVSERGEWRRGLTAAYFQIVESAANGAFRRSLDRIERNNAAIAEGRGGEYGRRIEVHVLAAEVPVHYLINFSADRLHEAVNRGVLAARSWCAERKIPLTAPPPRPARPDPVSLRFTESLRGTVRSPLARGGRAPLSVRLAVAVDDLDRFLTDPEHTASVSGRIRCPALGGERPLTGGTLHLLVDDGDDPARKRVRYRLHFSDGRGDPLTLIGVKRVESGNPLRMWSETTTLHTRVVRGDGTDGGRPRRGGPDGGAPAPPGAADGDTAPDVARGVLRLGAADFLLGLAGVRLSGSSPADRAMGLVRYGALFTGRLWDVYARPVLGWAPF